MPTRELPVRRRYVVESLILTVTAASGLSTTVHQAITLPDIPAGEIGERGLIELIKRLTGPATEAVQVLEELERRPGAKPTTRPAKERVKIEVRGQVVSPPSARRPTGIIGVAHGDGSSTDATGKRVTRSTPESPEGLTRPRKQTDE